MRYLKCMAVAITIAFASTGAQATVIDFEGGLDPFFTYTKVTTGGPSTAGSGYANVLSFTGSNRLAFNPFSRSPSTFSMSGPGTFDLNSFVIAGAWGSQTLTIEGLLNNATIFSSALPVTTAAQLVTLDWDGLDALRITIDPNGYTHAGLPGSGQHWALDNIVVNEAINQVEIPNNSQPVPEPGTLALFGLGLVGLGVARRRRKA